MSNSPESDDFLTPRHASAEAGMTSASPTTAAGPEVASTRVPAAVVASAEPAPPRLFGTYEIVGVVGKGGMGVVYRARDLKLGGREVALKMLQLVFDDPRSVERFHVEAEAAALLDHPNIVPIHEVNEHAGRHYYTMRLLTGGNLHEQRERFSGDARSAVALMEKVARGVQFAHEHGILHRDLKPGNILLDDRGEPLVGDFGLAKLLGTNLDLTETGAALGTPAYMAPEQAAGLNDQVTPASDVWSLGVILYELLTGVRPFPGHSRDEIFSHIRSADPTPPRRLRPKLDRGLETICLKCLRKEPRERYASAEAFADDLGCWLRGEPIVARPRPLWERLLCRLRRNSAVAGLVALAVLAVTAGVLYTTIPERKKEGRSSALARGERLPLIVDGRQPPASAWRLGNGEIDAGPGRPMGVAFAQTGLLELLEDVPRSSYRIVAKMQYERGEGSASEIGLYFAHRGVETNSGIVHLFSCLSFAEEGGGVRPRRLNADEPSRPCGKAALALWFWRDDHPGRAEEIGTPVHHYFPLREPRPLRTLAVAVTPDLVQVSWDGESIGEIATVTLGERMRRGLQPPELRPGRQPQYPELTNEKLFEPRGGLGLYGRDAAVRVHSFIVEPLE